MMNKNIIYPLKSLLQILNKYIFEIIYGKKTIILGIKLIIHFISIRKT